MENAPQKKVPSKPILILASATDDSARALAQRWASSGARLLLPQDLLRAGWQYHLGHIRDSVSVADGERFSAGDLGGVLTRISSISPHELIEVAPEDRSYIAQEINAFLVAWLSALPIPVVNRPTPICLSGPSWSHGQWVHAAANAGMRATPARRIAPGVAHEPYLPLSGTPMVITVVGKNCVGIADSVLRSHARKLAVASSTALLSVTFSGGGRDATFLSASTSPDLSSAEIADAVLDHFTDGKHSYAGRLELK